MAAKAVTVEEPEMVPEPETVAGARIMAGSANMTNISRGSRIYMERNGGRPGGWQAVWRMAAGRQGAREIAWT